MRLYADLENVKKRAAFSAESRFEQKKTHLLRDMLTLADNLERALASGSDGEGDGLREGIELTLKAFRSVMAKHGVDLIDARGQAFDPDLHEAVGFAPNADLAPGMVAQVEEAGYTLDGKLLRPARVLVTPER
jgi:molecular chaperone GrpE